MINTLILHINDPKAIPTAKKILEKGGQVAFPTDTIYGVAVDVFNPEAIQAIYAIKKRPAQKAIPVLIGQIQQLNLLVSEISEGAIKIAKAFWPGPLTLILPKGPLIPNELSPYPTIGVRMPDHRFTLALLAAAGPLATTSANISGDENPTSCGNVIDQLGGKIDLILDGGQTPGSTASTVLDITGDSFKILRQGSIFLSDVKALFDEDVI